MHSEVVEVPQAEIARAAAFLITTTEGGRRCIARGCELAAPTTSIRPCATA